MMKKLISILLACIMLCVSMTPVMAAATGRERVTIEVDTFADIYEFYKSPAHDKNKQYSFSIKYHPESRKRCPNCGKTAMTGQDYRVAEVDDYRQQCPGGPDTSSDGIVVMSYNYLERCHNCGYEIVHDEYYFDIYCENTFPSWPDEPITPAFQAWDGQRFENGYDIHEDKDTWWVVPSRYY